ncbi:MAG: hypothetical protein RKE49_06970 [Oceanicaulis sp.]
MSALGEGFYTVQEAAYLIGTADQRLRAWLRPSAKYGPAVKSDRVRGRGISDLSFHDLIELNFVEHFRAQGVSLQTLRNANDRAREAYGSHPFARSDLLFRTDRTRIYAEAASTTNDKRLLDLTENQHVLDVIEDTLREGIDFDPDTALARVWRPRSDLAVIVDPRVNFGRPSLEHHGLSTSALRRLWDAEKGDYAAVADWYGIPEAAVRDAVEFETVRIQ